MKETSHGLALMAGRLLACKVTRSRARVSIIGPIAEEVRAAIGAEPADDDEFKKIPGAALLTFPVEHAGEALRLLQDGLNSFVDLAILKFWLAPEIPEIVNTDKWSFVTFLISSRFYLLSVRF